MDTIFTGLDIWNRVPAAFEYENFFSGQVKLYLDGADWFANYCGINLYRVITQSNTFKSRHEMQWNNELKNRQQLL